MALGSQLITCGMDVKVICPTICRAVQTACSLSPMDARCNVTCYPLGPLRPFYKWGEGQEAADWLGWLQKLSGIRPTEKVPRGLQRQDSLVPWRFFPAILSTLNRPMLGVLLVRCGQGNTAHTVLAS